MASYVGRRGFGKAIYAVGDGDSIKAVIVAHFSDFLVEKKGGGVNDVY